jgi:hypothetical protein
MVTALLAGIMVQGWLHCTRQDFELTPGCDLSAKRQNFLTLTAGKLQHIAVQQLSILQRLFGRIPGIPKFEADKDNQLHIKSPIRKKEVVGRHKAFHMERAAVEAKLSLPAKGIGHIGRAAVGAIQQHPPAQLGSPASRTAQELTGKGAAADEPE